MKRLILLVLIFCQLLFASDKIILNNGVEYECRFIRFFETDNGQYVEIKIENNVSGLPIDQIKQIILEDSTNIFNNGQILIGDITIEKIEYKQEIKYDGDFPTEVMKAFPGGLLLSGSIINTRGQSIICPGVGHLYNPNFEPAFFGINVSLLPYYDHNFIVPSLIVGIKGVRRANYFCQFSGLFDVDDFEEVLSFSMAFGMSVSYMLTDDFLYSLKYGGGAGFSKAGAVPNLLVSNELIFEPGKKGVCIIPSIEFGLDMKEGSVATTTSISVVF